MADADGSIIIDSKLKTDNIEKQVKDFSQKLETAGTDASKKFEKLGDAINEIAPDLNISKLATVGFATAGVAALKKVVSVLNDCADAWRKQEDAETALTVAAKNSPYLDGSAVDALKDYASQLQSVSEIGDETSLQLMAQLASAGRTQSQIMDIMAAAADYAAGTQTDIASAVEQLNMTYSGMAGTLGRQISSVKDLTEAQLKNGDAVKAVAEAYKGMAKETANTTEQLSNAWGDFRENVGRGWDKALDPVRKELTELLTDINNAKSKANADNDSSDRINSGTATSADYKRKLDDAKEEYQNIQNMISDPDTYIGKGAWDSSTIEYYTKQLDIVGQKVSSIAKNYDTLKASEDAVKKAEKEKGDKAAAAQKEADSQKAATDAIIANREALEKQIEAIKLRAQLEGKSLDDVSVKQDILNAQVDSYIDLVQTVGSRAKTESENRLKDITAETNALKEQTEKEEEHKKIKDEADQIVDSDKSEYDRRAERLTALADLRKKVADDEVMTEEEKAAKIKAIDDETVKTKLENLNAILTDVQTYVDKSNEIIQNAGSLATKLNETEEEKKLTELETAHEKGLKSDDEYEKEKTKIKKEAAKRQYQIDMMTWISNLLSATANTAVGITSALKMGYAGIPLAAVIAAAGTVQTAAIAASKPVEPSFAGGGFVPGTSYTGDHVKANLNSKELVINDRQQLELWRMANGQGGRGTRITINNSASNLVSATPQIDDNTINIMIDTRVKQSLSKGKYNGALAAANSGMNGTAYEV